MAETLTARKIASLKPRSKQYDVWDAKTIGLGIRINPSGSKTWNVRFRVGRLQRRMKLGRFPNLSLVDARQEAQAALREADLGRDPTLAKRERREADTFKALAGRYLDEYALGGGVQPRDKRGGLLDADGNPTDVWKYKVIEGQPYKRSWGEDRRKLLKEVLPAWRNRPARDITRRDVRELGAAIARRGNLVQANRVRVLLHTVFNFAVEQEIVDHNPVTGTPMPGGSEKCRERVLTEDEIRTFWEATDSMEAPMRAFWRLCLITAQRVGEVKDMRWQDIGRDTTVDTVATGSWRDVSLRDADLQQAWVWTIPAEVSKNGLSHRVPLSALAVEILLADRELEYGAIVTARGSYVLIGARGNRLRIAAKKLIGIEDFRGHDLRRTAATFMAKAKIPRVVLRKVLNHADSGVTAVYDRHSYDEQKRVALDTWGRTLTAILERDRSADVLPFARA